MEIEVKTELQNERSTKEADGGIANLFGKSMLHGLICLDEDGIYDEFERAEFGQDIAGEMEKKLIVRVGDNKKKGPRKRCRKPGTHSA